MPANKQLKIGLQVEKEHKGTIGFIKKYYSKNDALPPNKLIYKHIALDHLKESPSYYIRLKKAKL